MPSQPPNANAPWFTADTDSANNPVVDNSVPQNGGNVNNNSQKDGLGGADAGNTVGAAQSGFDPFSQAENRYGVQDGGENAVRPDDAPVSTNGEDRVSRSVVTVKGAQATPDDFVPLIENETMKGGFSFMRVTNDETTAAARDNIIRLGWEDALTKWRKDVAAGKTSDAITATGALLYNNLRFVITF